MRPHPPHLSHHPCSDGLRQFQPGQGRLRRLDAAVRYQRRPRRHPRSAEVRCRRAVCGAVRCQLPGSWPPASRPWTRCLAPTWTPPPARATPVCSSARRGRRHRRAAAHGRGRHPLPGLDTQAQRRGALCAPGQRGHHGRRCAPRLPARPGRRQQLRRGQARQALPEVKVRSSPGLARPERAGLVAVRRSARMLFHAAWVTRKRNGSLTGR